MKVRPLKWVLAIGAMILLLAGNTLADGRDGRGPGHGGGGQGYHGAPQPPNGHGRPGSYCNPPHFRPCPPQYVYHRAYYGHNHGGHYQVYQEPRPYYVAPARPQYAAIPLPPPGFLFSALIGQPGLMFGITMGN